MNGVERPGPGRGLSARLLALTVAFLLLGEVLIFVPSVVRFRRDYLNTMIASAHLASLAKIRDMGVTPAFEAELLTHVGAQSISLWRPDAEVMLGRPTPTLVAYDLERADPVRLIVDTLTTMIAPAMRMVRVTGPSPQDPAVLVDVTFDETAMRGALRAYAWRVLALSLVLSAIVASLLLFGLRRLIVRPLVDLTGRLSEFRRMPEAAMALPAASARHDEVGVVEREFAQMCRQIQEALMQRTRLAALGAAVARVSHDLKSILAAAVLISDRLETSADPSVRAVAPSLVATLERAVRLCTETLRFAREQPRPPAKSVVLLHEMVGQVGVLVRAGDERLAWDNAVPPSLTVLADRDQLFRVFLNLGHNSKEAFADGAGTVACTAARTAGGVEIRLRDTGPGIPEQFAGRLFETFPGSTKHDGNGLGLAICREIMRAHGGDITLVETGPAGTEFKLYLPDGREWPVA